MTTPAPLLAIFDGDALAEKVGVSAIVATVDEAGQPHLSFLSVGEVLVVDDRIALTLWSQAKTLRALDLQRSGTFFAATNGSVSEFAFTVEAIRRPEGVPTARVLGRLGARREHRAPYADVESLIGFKLHDPIAATQRWTVQIAAMRLALATDR